MKDYKNEFEVDGVKYPLVFDLNSMEAIQEEYQTIQKWGELTDGKSGEVNVKALIFGFTEMINEGIDIENEEKGEKREFLTTKQVGRLITKLGIENSAKKLNETVVESARSEEKN